MPLATVVSLVVLHEEMRSHHEGHEGHEVRNSYDYDQNRLSTPWKIPGMGLSDVVTKGNRIGR